MLFKISETTHINLNTITAVFLTEETKGDKTFVFTIKCGETIYQKEYKSAEERDKAFNILQTETAYLK